MGLRRPGTLHTRLRCDRAIKRITVEDNACSRKTKKTVTIKRKPGASPLLFGKYLMDHCAFIGLEDSSDSLPSYREEVVPVAMGEPLKSAYEELEDEIAACLKEHRGQGCNAQPPHRPALSP